MFHKIKSVSPLPDFVLLLHFVDGTAKTYDMKPLLDQMEAFADLKHIPSLFEQVSTDPGGYGISWNDEIDLDGEELWVNGQEIKTPFTGLLSFADASTMWGLHESTLRKAISYGKLKNGLDAIKFGKQWVVTQEAMKREYGEPPTAP